MDDDPMGVEDVTDDDLPDYARWTEGHRDTHQTYDAKTDPLNSFVTHCTCGHTTRGMDPDDADAAMLDHTANPIKTADPRYTRGASDTDDDMTDAEWTTAYGTHTNPEK